MVKGQPITSEYIHQLEKIGIPTVTVTSSNPNFQLFPPEDVVQEKTRINAIKKVYDAFLNVEKTGELDVEAMQGVSEDIIFDIIERKENLVQLTDIRLHDTYTFAHSVNVAILSAMLGMLCHYPKKDLLLLTLGALLHDLGKINVPPAILTKSTRLDEEEFAIIKQHPLDGAVRILNMKQPLPSPSVLAAIASQHHEHINGQGYPRGLQAGQIHRFAKIVAIADVYDALTSERPYKKAYTAHVAYNIMKNVMKGQFDEDLLQLFFNNVSIYPVGTILKTIYGYAIVKDCIFGKTEMPTIILFADHDGNILSIPHTVYLSKDPAGNKAIEIVLSDNDLRHFIHEINIDPSVFLAD
ncbi:HD-GYP domain, c-di-GMP phosphodiesterase class II (or its inactivated variant) [Selenomonas sp. GACV-9]|nr:HD-GYP domain, c-di-GMP phosphodiesterase class II (or its inactivated variant) [Selenomonas ruminantium]